MLIQCLGGVTSAYIVFRGVTYACIVFRFGWLRIFGASGVDLKIKRKYKINLRECCCMRTRCVSFGQIFLG